MWSGNLEGRGWMDRYSVAALAAAFALPDAPRTFPRDRPIMVLETPGAGKSAASAQLALKLSTLEHEAAEWGRRTSAWLPGHGSTSHWTFSEYVDTETSRFPASQATDIDRTRLYGICRATSIEQTLGIEPRLTGPSTSATSVGRLLAGRRTRHLRATVLARVLRRHVAGDPGQLVASLARIILRRIIKAIGRLLSACWLAGAGPAPPGQVVTAYPHVTRGPTPRRATTFLSALGRPAHL